MPDADGIIGWASPGKGQQTGHLVLARTPHWDGFIQCSACNLPRSYPWATAERTFRVNIAGAHSCATCRRHGWADPGPWYPAALRVFQPDDTPNSLGIVRVVPRAVFAGAWWLWPRPGQAALRNSYLLGYAAQVLDGLPVPDTHKDAMPPYAIDTSGGTGLNRAWQLGRRLAHDNWRAALAS